MSAVPSFVAHSDGASTIPPGHVPITFDVFNCYIPASCEESSVAKESNC